MVAAEQKVMVDASLVESWGFFFFFFVFEDLAAAGWYFEIVFLFFFCFFDFLSSSVQQVRHEKLREMTGRSEGGRGKGRE